MNNFHNSKRMPRNPNDHRSVLKKLQEKEVPNVQSHSERLCFHLIKLQEFASMLEGAYCMSLSEKQLPLNTLIHSDAFVLIDIHTEAINKAITANELPTIYSEIWKKYNTLVLNLSNAKLPDAPVIQVLDVLYFAPLVLKNHIMGESLLKDVDKSLIDHESHSDFEIRFGIELLGAEDPAVIMRKLTENLSSILQ